MHDFSSFKLSDTHAHISFPQFDKDRQTLLDQLKDRRLSLIIEVGISVEDSLRAFDMLKDTEDLYFAAGVHPHESDSLDREGVKKLEGLLHEISVVAVGEIGLDFFRDLSPRKKQLEVFEMQLEIAERLEKPVIVHIRDAYEEAFGILRDYTGPKGVIHAFSSDIETARRFLDLGFSLGIGGPVTYKKNDELREVVRWSPIDSLLCETDCPYLPPVPFRGKRNQPLYIGYVIEEIANQKSLDSVSCSNTLHDNAVRLFSLDL